MSQCSEFFRRNPLRCFSTCVCCCKRVFRYRHSTETFGYTLVYFAFLCSSQCSNRVHTLLYGI